MSNSLHPYKLVARTLRLLLPDLVEVVVHDLRTNKIYHIENAFTHRCVDDDSLLETENYENEMNEEGVLGPYVKTNPDGSKVKSISMVITEEASGPIGLLCINMRIDGFELSLQHLKSIVSFQIPDAEPILKNDWRETANVIISKTLLEMNVSLSHAKKTDRLAIIKALNEADIFLSRGSADYVAEALGISRASFYQLLKASKQSTDAM
ncbi:PAS domain-containing protein [Marinomonas sp. 15G1-11]|uniref:PAS domain-containing protein n=1 Tax=Marinomonas phaeophyticola TaxID=3004091 RepID=A0ABT4JPH9_9GAMM|nr:PAS domain-containing protein [Marinomonas sp. 15G1-11]MCZ2720282.1 PAS domain-containing protein [Marinomonas sp. 15G1-11]